ncbi:hypothetical protein RhiirA4_475068 [Rhizophagus irregularis]|uniref:Uncharacterized protein n=1 Tax=Rhizophagus irregularis TaxID=588596 RepID=A0A2I1H9I8_9GLOM|nr:hypothetical protein RhiirA4_475068 [Rhizophagus irregularis]
MNFVPISLSYPFKAAKISKESTKKILLKFLYDLHKELYENIWKQRAIAWKEFKKIHHINKKSFTNYRRDRPRDTHHRSQRRNDHNNDTTINGYHCPLNDTRRQGISTAPISSTGNLIAHLQDIHQIIDEDESENNSKRVILMPKNIQMFKVYDQIQKQWEESLLKWMLLTNQLISAVTNPAYKEKMTHFDPSFVVPGEQKIKTMIIKSFKKYFNRAKHGYIGITATWITPDFKVKDVMLEIKYAPLPN